MLIDDLRDSQYQHYDGLYSGRSTAIVMRSTILSKKHSELLDFLYHACSACQSPVLIDCDTQLAYNEDTKSFLGRYRYNLDHDD